MADPDDPVGPDAKPPRAPGRDGSHRDRISGPPSPRPGTAVPAKRAARDHAPANDADFPPPGNDPDGPPRRLRSIPLWVPARRDPL
jgi:hypothetical protein